MPMSWEARAATRVILSRSRSDVATPEGLLCALSARATHTRATASEEARRRERAGCEGRRAFMTGLLEENEHSLPVAKRERAWGLGDAWPAKFSLINYACQLCMSSALAHGST